MYGNNQPFISISKEKYHYEVKCCVYKYIDTERIYNNRLWYKTLQEIFPNKRKKINLSAL